MKDKVKAVVKKIEIGLYLIAVGWFAFLYVELIRGRDVYQTIATLGLKPEAWAPIALISFFFVLYTAFFGVYWTIQQKEKSKKK